MAERSLGERELELKYQLRFRFIDVVSKALDRLIPGAVAVLIVYFGIYRTAHELAGKETFGAFWIGLLADIKPDEIMAWLTALIGWMFGINSQRLRRNTTERLSSRIRELEQRVDPNRTTSGLTPRGQTPPDAQ